MAPTGTTLLQVRVRGDHDVIGAERPGAIEDSVGVHAELPEEMVVDVRPDRKSAARDDSLAIERLNHVQVCEWPVPRALGEVEISIDALKRYLSRVGLCEMIGEVQ